MPKLTLKKVIVRAAVFITACVSSFGLFSACTEPSFAAPFGTTVGVILPLTGDGAGPGTSVRNGMLLAMRKLPPEDKQRIEFVFEDDQMIPKNTVAAYQRLHSVVGIKAVITFTSATSNALAPIAEADQIPHLAIGSDPAISCGKKYVMNFMVMPATEARILVPEALRRGYKRIARINTIQQGTYALRDAFDEVNQGRISLVLDEDYTPDNKDFRPFIIKLKSYKDIDAIFPNFLFGQVGAFAKQVREAGINLPLFGYHDFENLQELKVSQGALAGGWYANPASPSDGFVTEYQREFPDSALSFAAYGHDLVLLLAKARSAGASSEEINHFLHRLKDFSGALGVYSADGKNSFTLPAMLKIVGENGFMPAK
jgi:branched-chain amino acid transport system substrate-binding protein